MSDGIRPGSVTPETISQRREEAERKIADTRKWLEELKTYCSHAGAIETVPDWTVQWKGKPPPLIWECQACRKQWKDKP